MSGVSYSFRTWRSCQIIMVSSTVPMPPGTTTKASETSTKWCSREKNVRCSKTWPTNGLTSCSNGELDADADGRSLGVRTGHAGPLVRRLHEPGAAAGDDVAAQARQLRRQVPDGRIDPVVGVSPG